MSPRNFHQFFHKLWKISFAAVKLVEALAIADVHDRKSLGVGNGISKILADCLKETTTVILRFGILLADVLAKIPVEFQQGGVDGYRGLDLRGAIPLFESRNPTAI